MQRVRVHGAVVVIALFALGLGACSRTTARHVDVTQGEYYSEEEYEKLSRGQKSKYCSNMGGELASLQSQVENKQEELRNTRKEIESLRNQITPLEREILRVDSDIRTLNSQIQELEALPKFYTVKPGDTMDIIAMQEDIYNDPAKWQRIYRANLDKIDDPMWIYPDTVLTIPRDVPTEYKVIQYETLEEIAGFWEVYGDSTKWTRLLEANRSKIKDPYVLPPGLVIKIPRD